MSPTVPPALRFVTIDADLRDRLTADPAGFAEACGVEPPAGIPELLEIVEATLALHAAVPRPAPWGGYLAVDPVARAIVGTCGYKSGPDAGGCVEIAYYTFPAFERRGYATAMARHLVAIAGEEPALTIIRAHTLSERNASARILEELRFRRLGIVIDPDDGTVWRWERHASR